MENPKPLDTQELPPICRHAKVASSWGDFATECAERTEQLSEALSRLSQLQGMCDELTALADKRLDLIVELEKENQWISVKEELPQDEDWEKVTILSRPDFIAVRTLPNGQREFLTHNEALCAQYYLTREVKR